MKKKSEEINKRNPLLGRCIGCDADCEDFDCWKLGEPRPGIDEVHNFPTKLKVPKALGS